MSEHSQRTGIQQGVSESQVRVFPWHLVWVYFTTGCSGIIPRAQRCGWNNNSEAVIHLSTSARPAPCEQWFKLCGLSELPHHRQTQRRLKSAVGKQQHLYVVHLVQAQLKSRFYLDYKAFTWLGAHWILSPVWQIYEFPSAPSKALN